MGRMPRTDSRTEEKRAHQIVAGIVVVFIGLDAAAALAHERLLAQLAIVFLILSPGLILLGGGVLAGARAYRRRRSGRVVPTRPMSRRSRRVFRVSYRVQVAGVMSLLAVPLVLAVVAWALVAISPWLFVGVAAAFVIGVQAAIAKRWTGARPKAVSAQDAPTIHAAVERLCAVGGLYKPQIVLHDKHYANSWITGLTSYRTTLHLTTRLVELLNERQLSAVIAHELSHVGQKDSALMTAVGGPVAAMLDGASLYFHTPAVFMTGLRSQAHAPNRTADQRDAETLLFADSAIILAIVWLLLLPIVILLMAVGSTCLAITAVFSRARELEADAGAARLTGSPTALATALMLIADTPTDKIPLVDLRRAASLDVFHIVPIGREHLLAHTHPTLRRRLKQLEQIEERNQSGSP
jgi:heat shock protein HtpX